jgi:hypothetical protein
MIDDVAFGKFFHEQQIPVANAPRTIFSSIQMWNEQKDNIPKYAFHFRTKNPSALGLLDELYVQRELLKMFYGIEAQ